MDKFLDTVPIGTEISLKTTFGRNVWLKGSLLESDGKTLTINCYVKMINRNLPIKISFKEIIYCVVLQDKCYNNWSIAKWNVLKKNIINAFFGFILAYLILSII